MRERGRGQVPALEKAAGCRNRHGCPRSLGDPAHHHLGVDAALGVEDCGVDPSNTASRHEYGAVLLRRVARILLQLLAVLLVTAWQRRIGDQEVEMPSQMGVEMIEPGADNVPIVSALPDDMVVLANGWGVMLGGGQMFIGLCG